MGTLALASIDNCQPVQAAPEGQRQGIVPVKKDHGDTDQYIQPESKDASGKKSRSLFEKIIFESLKIGAIIGLSIFAGVAFGPIVGILAGGFLTAGFSAYEQYEQKKEIDWKRVAIEFGLGLLSMGVGKFYTRGANLLLNGARQGAISGMYSSGVLQAYDSYKEGGKIDFVSVLGTVLFSGLLGGVAGYAGTRVFLGKFRLTDDALAKANPRLGKALDSYVYNSGQPHVTSSRTEIRIKLNEFAAKGQLALLERDFFIRPHIRKFIENPISLTYNRLTSRLINCSYVSDSERIAFSKVFMIRTSTAGTDKIHVAHDFILDAGHELKHLKVVKLSPSLKRSNNIDWLNLRWEHNLKYTYEPSFFKIVTKMVHQDARIGCAKDYASRAKLCIFSEADSFKVYSSRENFLFKAYADLKLVKFLNSAPDVGIRKAEVINRQIARATRRLEVVRRHFLRHMNGTEKREEMELYNSLVKKCNQYLESENWLKPLSI